MIGPMTLVLRRVRIYGARFFYAFGIHCATHQIRVVLISCVVITSLFYPALAIYSSSHAQSLPDSTSRILDTLLAAKTVSGFRSQGDLRNIWAGHNALRVREDAVSRSRCGLYQTLRLERILIQSPLIQDAGVLNRHILQSTLQLEHRISEILSARKMRCLQTPDGECFILSPLAFWNYDEQKIIADSNVLDTLGIKRNVSLKGISITPHMVLAGRRVNEHTGSNFDSATYLAVTYYFPEEDCLGSSDHAAWIQIVKEAAGQNVLTQETQPPILLALEYDPSSSKSSRFSAISTFLYLAYTAFIVFVSWSMRRMDAVHSRIGLTFTALVEIAVSTVTSLSVCALVGFKVTMVPWQLLPIVIVFVGAENMFSLVDAVVKTSVALPVKLRIAEGLSRAGTSNSLKVVTYNAILGVIAVFAAGAIRQFCVFAIVVLVAHWFLAHTFFMAVLSVDIQRLELDELLRQNASLAQTIPKVSDDTSRLPQSHTRGTKIVIAAKNLLKGRATKNMSLLLLLAITATLYYTTYPSTPRSKDDTTLTGALSRTADPVEHSPARHIWKLLNPGEDDLLHVRIEMPTIITLGREDSSTQRTKYHANGLIFTMSMIQPLLRMFKIVVLPITATTTFLYGLLLYLLKDAELLEAQRNRAEPDTTEAKDDAPLAGHVSFKTVPRAFASDVELIAASGDGNVVAAVGMHNELVIWLVDHGSHISIDTADILLHAASTSSSTSDITAVAVDSKGRFCAVGTGGGNIAVWSITETSVHPLPHLLLDNLSSTVTELQFSNSKPSTLDSFIIPPTIVLAIYGNGIAVKWSVGNISTAKYVTPSGPSSVIKCTSFHVDTQERLFAVFIMQDGIAEIVEVSDSESPLLFPECRIQAGNPNDRVSKVHGCCSHFGEDQRLIIGAATEAGVVSLWDAGSSECISIFDDVYGEIGNLRISPVSCKTCHFCGELPLDRFSVSFSVGHVVLLHEVYIPAQSRRCACVHNQPRKTPSLESILGRRSRGNSVVSSNGSIAPPRSRKTSMSTNSSALDRSAFPVSGHGIHSRRVSEKDSRRALENLSVTLATDERESFYPVGPFDTAPTLPSSFWHTVVVRRIADAVCERGSWDVSGTNVIGIRRRPRSREKLKVASVARGDLPTCLTAAALDRWELWLFDSSTSRLRASPLVSLNTVCVPVRRSSDKLSYLPQDEIPRLPFTRVRPIFTGNCFGLAGFGNTIGFFSFVPS